jgi:hypothetical protein
MSTTINFTKDIPRLGDNIVVKETIGQVTNRLIIAKKNNHATVSFTMPDDKQIVVLVELIGAAEARD